MNFNKRREFGLIKSDKSPTELKEILGEKC